MLYHIIQFLFPEININYTFQEMFHFELKGPIAAFLSFQKKHPIHGLGEYIESVG
jgi:hypothetical protein